MSEDNYAVVLSCCASCGIAEVDEVKLKECSDCDLVKYCSDECMQDHKSQHEEACKKRAAELRDELLFMFPESTHLGDCPICMLPLPLDLKKSGMTACCSKVICRGCSHANEIREAEGKLQHKCAFCREPTPTKEEADKYQKKRIEANDPYAIYRKGAEQYKKGDYYGAFEYYTKAAELGDIVAHFELSHMYGDGDGVEKDMGKEIYHRELAAIGGHPKARHNLGCHEWKNRNPERAVKHWFIAAAQGRDESIELLLAMYKDGVLVIKDILAAALREHQAAVDATKSPQREAAEEYRRKMKSSK